VLIKVDVEQSFPFVIIQGVSTSSQTMHCVTGAEETGARDGGGVGFLLGAGVSGSSEGGTQVAYSLLPKQTASPQQSLLVLHGSHKASQLVWAP